MRIIAQVNAQLREKMSTEKEYDEFGRVIRENRSQIKREREKVRQFAEELLKLPARQYERLPLNDLLIQAFIEGKRLKGNAYQRHLNFITRLLLEHDIEAVSQAHKHVNHAFIQDPKRHQMIDKTIEQLLTGDKHTLSALLTTYEAIDLQYTRQLLRSLQKEINTQNEGEEENRKSPNVLRHWKKLHQYLASLALCQHDV